MPDIVGALAYVDALDLAPAARIEQAELDALGVLRRTAAKLTPAPSQLAPSG